VTKEELVHITLKQLAESFKSSPENFRLEDSELGPVNGSFPGPTIIWQFKVKVKENEYIQDPLNATRTIIVTFNSMAKQLSCLIYFREVNSIGSAIAPDTQATVQCCEFPILHRTYRQFRHIRKLLVTRRREKEFMDYMKKLNNIFPAIHEDELFK
jgi:hypothetical protein